MSALELKKLKLVLIFILSLFYSCKNINHTSGMREENEAGSAYSKILSAKSIVDDISLVQYISSDMEYEDDLELTKDLRLLIDNTKTDKSAPTICAAANAITCLVASKYSFSGQDLSDIAIKGANVRSGLFHYTDFTNSDLTGVNFTNSYLCDAKFVGTNMRDIELGIRYSDSYANSPVFSIQYSQDGKLLGIMHIDGKLFIVDSESMCLILSIPVKSQAISYLGVKFDFSSNSKNLAVPNGTHIDIWDIPCYEQVHQIYASNQSVQLLKWTEDLLFSHSSDSLLKIWETESWTNIHSIYTGYSFLKNILSINLARGYYVVLNGITNNSIEMNSKILNMDNYEEVDNSFWLSKRLPKYKNYFVGAISFNAGLAVLVNYVSRTIKTLRESDKEDFDTTIQLNSLINCICYVPDSECLIVPQFDGSIVLYDLRTGFILSTLNLDYSNNIKKIDSDFVTTEGIEVFKEAFGGKTLEEGCGFVLSGKHQNYLHMNNEEWKEVFSGENIAHMINRVGVQFNQSSPTTQNSLKVACANDMILKPFSDEITIASQNKVCSFSIKGILANNFYSPNSSISKVEIISNSKTGNQLAFSLDDNSIYLHCIGSSMPSIFLHKHQDKVSSLTFSLDGNLLASGSFDKTVKIFNTSDMSLSYNLEFDCYVADAAFTIYNKIIVLTQANNIRFKDYIKSVFGSGGLDSMFNNHPIMRSIFTSGTISSFSFENITNLSKNLLGDSDSEMYSRMLSGKDIKICNLLDGEQISLSNFDDTNSENSLNASAISCSETSEKFCLFEFPDYIIIHDVDTLEISFIEQLKFQNKKSSFVDRIAYLENEKRVIFSTIDIVGTNTFENNINIFNLDYDNPAWLTLSASNSSFRIDGDCVLYSNEKNIQVYDCKTDEIIDSIQHNHAINDFVYSHQGTNIFLLTNKGSIKNLNLAKKQSALMTKSVAVQHISDDKNKNSIKASFYVIEKKQYGIEDYAWIFSRDISFGYEGDFNKDRVLFSGAFNLPLKYWDFLGYNATILEDVDHGKRCFSSYRNLTEFCKDILIQKNVNERFWNNQNDIGKYNLILDLGLKKLSFTFVSPFFIKKLSELYKTLNKESIKNLSDNEKFLEIRSFWYSHTNSDHHLFWIKNFDCLDYSLYSENCDSKLEAWRQIKENLLDSSRIEMGIQVFELEGELHEISINKNDEVFSVLKREKSLHEEEQQFLNMKAGISANFPWVPVANMKCLVRQLVLPAINNRKSQRLRSISNPANQTNKPKKTNPELKKESSDINLP
jgi:WD40 repeat protein